MTNEELVAKITEYKTRLHADVVDGYHKRGDAYGRQRFDAWRRAVASFLRQELPSVAAEFENLFVHVGFVMLRNETDAQRFWREDGEQAESFLDSLIVDIRNGELVRDHRQAAPSTDASAGNSSRRAVFIVHGHDALLKTEVARFLERLEVEPIILHEQANRGMTIIEKIEHYTDVSFAVVLLTPDDLGNSTAEAKSGVLNPRARQNVVFEHGYLTAKLGRARVITLVSGSLELPSDLSGVVYVSDKSWRLDVAKELRAGGLEVDLNRAL